MKFRLITTILAALISISAINAKGKYVVKVNDFDELQITNNIAVDYYCRPDSAGYAILYTDNAHADMILFDNNRKGRLSVLTDADYDGKEALPHVIIYSSGLKKIYNCGDSLVKAFDIPTTEKFRATLIGNGRLVVRGIEATSVTGSIDSGNGQLILSGECKTAKLRNVGTGSIQADELTATSVSASIVGTGSIGCNPLEKLSILGTGSGEVFYRQTPAEIKSHTIGIKHSILR